MKKKSIFLAVFAVLLALAGTAGSAWAYFTTYVEAKGGYTISLGDKTTVEEDFNSWTKHIMIANDVDSEPVYVRARAYCGSQYNLVYTAAEQWTPGSDGYYYYSGILNGGEKTSELLVRIENVPENVTDVSEFNVAVIYETTPVLYDEDGNPYADWDGELDVTIAEGGSN